MKDYSVTIQVSFSIEARNEEHALERAQEVADSMKPTHFSWLGDDFEIDEPNVQEA